MVLLRNLSLIAIGILASTNLWAKQDSIYTRTLLLMGSRFDLTLTAADPNEGKRYLDMAIDEIQRIERLISSWDAQSQTTKINKLAGVKPVQVSKELYGLITRAKGLSQLTDGAFDISYASMDKIWIFDGSTVTLPPKEKVSQAVAKVGYRNIVLDPTKTSVFLKQKGMKIGFGAIGKGYAADQAKALLQSHGVKAGIINASGDLSAWGKRPNGKSWKVGITNPLNKNKVFATLPVDNQAIVTSGNYEKFITLDGKRYSHIIDPRTGYPSSGIVSVTVIAPKAELADALATSVFVMGVHTGIDRINQLPQVECIIVDDQGKIHTSNHITLNTKNEI